MYLLTKTKQCNNVTKLFHLRKRAPSLVLEKYGARRPVIKRKRLSSYVHAGKLFIGKNTSGAKKLVEVAGSFSHKYA